MPPTLVDTSVLARLLERDSAKGRAAERLLRKPSRDLSHLCVCAQVLTEFWVVATRPESANGYGLSVPEASASVDDILDAFAFLTDPPDLFDRWRQLVIDHGVMGKPAHDARLVALLRAYAGQRVLTFNPRDF